MSGSGDLRLSTHSRGAGDRGEERERGPERKIPPHVFDLIPFMILPISLTHHRQALGIVVPHVPNETATSDPSFPVQGSGTLIQINR